MRREAKTNILVMRLEALRRVASAILAGTILFSVPMLATASYLPFNTSVNMNVGIGTSTPQGAFVVTNGNVGIGTWAPQGALVVQNGNVGIGAVNPQATLQMESGSPSMIMKNDSAGITWTWATNVNSNSFLTLSANSFPIMQYSATGVSIGEGVSLLNDPVSASLFIGASGIAPLDIVTGQAEAMRVTSSGNLGIGTGAAASKLTVYGGVGIGTGSNSSYVETTAPDGGLIVQGNVGIGSLAPGQALDVTGTVRMTGLTLTGNGAANGNVLVSNSVGIGTWMSASALGTFVGSNYWLNDTTGNVGISTIYAVGIGTTFVGGAGEAALSVMNGNVGIGTWTPGLALAIGPGGLGGYGITAGGTVVAGALHGNSSLQTMSIWAGGTFQGGEIDLAAGGAASNPGTIVFKTGTVSGGQPEQMRLDANGNLGIGSTSPIQTLDVKGTVRAIGLTMSGQTPVSGYVLTASDSSGDATWSPSSSVGTNYWLNDTTGNVGISTTYAVGIGTTFVGGTGEAALSVMNGNVGIGTWAPAGALNVMNGEVMIGTSTDFVDTYAPHQLLVSGPDNSNVFAITNTAKTSKFAFYMNSSFVVPVQMGSISNNNYGIFTNNGNPQFVLDTNGGATIGGTYYTFTAPANGLMVQGNVGIGTFSNIGGGLIVLPANTGNVGIGSLTPGQALDVNGTVRSTGLTLTGNGASNGNVLVSNSIGVGTWMPASTLATLVGSNYWLNDTTGNVGISTTYAVGIGTTFVGGTGEAALSVMNGNVGIGTWVPGEQLSVAGEIYTGNATNNIVINPLANPATIISSTNWLQLGDGGTNLTIEGGGEQVIIASSGTTINGANVGIGTVSPGQALDVTGTVRAIGFTMSGQTPISGYVLTTSDSNGDATWSPSSSVGTNYWLNDITGNVGISTTYAVGIGTAFVGGTGEAALSVMNGNVGIGTWIAPAALVIKTGNLVVNSTTDVQGTALYVNGSGYFQGQVEGANGSPGSIAQTGLFVNSGTTVGTAVQIGLDNNDLSFNAQPTGTITAVANVQTSGAQTGDMYFSTINAGSSTEKMRITGAGNVGIGSWGANSPNNTLSVVGNIGIGTNQSSSFIQTSAPNGGMIIQGNVGIGSLHPGQALDINGTARMTGFTLTGNGAASGNVMVTNGVGVGTWMSTTTLPIATVTIETPGDVTYYNAPNSFAGGSGFQTNGTNVGIGTSNFTNASLQVVGNIGIGTVGNGDKFITTPPPNGGMILEGSVGIGTWAPSAKLSAVDSFSGTAKTVFVIGSTGGAAGTDIGMQFQESGFPGQDGAGIRAVDDGSSNMSLRFDTDFANTLIQNQMVISGSGNVGIGTAYPFGGKLIIPGGNVGIGTLVPGQALDVTGTVRAIGLTMSGQTPISGYVLTAQDNAGDVTWSSPGTVSGWTISGNNVYETSGGNVGIGTINPFGGNLIVNGGGNVGIGSLAPGQMLDVQGTARVLGEIVNGNVGIGTSFINGAGEGAVSVMNGNVGIGTWLPAGQIDVEGTLSIAIFHGNVGIGTATVPAYNLDLVNGTARERNVRRIQTTASSASLTINTDITDLYTITALAAAITFNNPTGTPNNGDLLEIRILDNGTARAIAWGANFASTSTTLPATTVVSTTMRVLLEYDSAQTKWECIGVT